jgi:hypothetical protein
VSLLLVPALNFSWPHGLEFIPSVSGIILVELSKDGSLTRFLTRAERFGRRKLMIGGAAGMAISMAVLAASVWKIEKNGPDSTDMGPAIAATVFFFVYNTFFGIGWLGMSYAVLLI